jgi:hypothetical protein
VIDRSVARLVEHDVSRRHESGLLMIKKIQPQSFLSLGVAHYLTPRVLTTCARKVAHASGLRANANASWKLALPLGFVHSRIPLLSFRPEQSSVEESLYTPEFREAVRASPLVSFRPERSAVEESLYTPDFRKAVRASPLVSFRPARSAVEKSLGVPEFREAIRA